MTATNPAVQAAIDAMEAVAAEAAADPDRPLYHFCPPAGWMNDVNGPLFHEGWYHIFYQLNPFVPGFGDLIYWGHARSRDLVHWEHLAPAIWPSQEAGETGCWSGTACFDGDGRPMIFYTRAGGDGPFEQWAAVGDRDLVTWQKHPANPILSLEKHGRPGFDGGWRDPFIFAKAGRTFMVIGAAGPGTPIYEATDPGLTSWRYQGLMTGISGECPNFVELGGRWMLMTSPFGPVDYHIGEFSLDTLRFEADTHGTLEKTGCFYGTNVLLDDKGRCIFLGRLLDFGPGRKWNGCMALPRLLSLGPDGLPRQEPVPELRVLRRNERTLASFAVDDQCVPIAGIEGEALELIVELAPENGATAGLILRHSPENDGGVEIAFDGRSLTIADRSFDCPPVSGSQALKLHVFLDRSVIEVFANDGAQVATPVVLPVGPGRGVAAFSRGGRSEVRSLQAWELAPAQPVWGGA
jgi:beta-fructofuranosidase